MLLRIVSEVAALAEGGEVVIGVVAHVVIQVRDGEDNRGAGDGMRLAVDGATARVAGRAFAAIPGAFQNARADDGAPVGRIERVIDGHGSLPRLVSLPALSRDLVDGGAEAEDGGGELAVTLAALFKQDHHAVGLLRVIFIDLAQGPCTCCCEQDATAEATDGPDDEAVEVFGHMHGLRGIVFGDGVESVSGHGQTCSTMAVIAQVLESAGMLPPESVATRLSPAVTPLFQRAG